MKVGTKKVLLVCKSNLKVRKSRVILKVEGIAPHGNQKRDSTAHSLVRQVFGVADCSLWMPTKKGDLYDAIQSQKALSAPRL